MERGWPTNRRPQNFSSMLIKIVGREPRPLRLSVFYKNEKGVRRPPLAIEGVAIEEVTSQTPRL